MDYILPFFVMIVPLVLFHEFGHFIVAKLAGMKVNEFAFGFGKKLFGFHFKGTDYRFNLLPLGGYVDFMGEVNFSGRIPDDADHFYNQPKWVRLLVLVMGPAFNLILGFLLMWLVYSVGHFSRPIYHGELYTVGWVAPDSPEAAAGLQIGDRIVALNGSALTSREDLRFSISTSPGKEVSLEIERGETRQTINYKVAEDDIEGHGLMQFDHALRYAIRDVEAGSPADQAGLQPGDIIAAMDGKPLFASTIANPLFDYINADNTQFPVQVTVIREDGRKKDLAITPKKNQDGQHLLGIRIGLESKSYQLGPVAAMKQAGERFVVASTMIYKSLEKMVTGDMPLKTLSGPIGIGRAAKDSWDGGWLWFLLMMAILSINLGIINLLPIPVLDGGEMFVILVEWISRREFDLMTKWHIKLTGLAFLAVLMLFVMGSDILKVFKLISAS